MLEHTDGLESTHMLIHSLLFKPPSSTNTSHRQVVLIGFCWWTEKDKSDQYGQFASHTPSYLTRMELWTRFLVHFSRSFPLNFKWIMCFSLMNIFRWLYVPINPFLGDGMLSFLYLFVWFLFCGFLYLLINVWSNLTCSLIFKYYVQSNLICFLS